jgi:UDP-3-O-[3-hydroxymyristoyl] glucosamine N-acyltransferase
VAPTRRRTRSSASGVALPTPAALGELVEGLGGALDVGAEALVVRAIAPVEDADAGELAPVTARRFVRHARESEAALLVDEALASLVPAGRRWVHPSPALALARLLARLAPPAPPDDRALAHVDVAADVHPTASIGPGAVIYAGAVVGAGTRVEANAVVYGGARIGARVTIGACAVVGRPGFGWAIAPSGAERVPQLGGVVIEDDVEIGPLATIDAGTLGPTVIERGAKLDAHVHVGHNARVGAGTIIAAQAGFAGSSRVGAGVLVGGQAGVADHVTVGDGARLAAKAGVIGDVAPGAVVAGYPAVDRARWLRATARSLAEGEAPRPRRKR